MKVINVTVQVKIQDGYDPHEVIADCDYSFSGDGIVNTEITEIEVVGECADLESMVQSALRQIYNLDPGKGVYWHARIIKEINSGELNYDTLRQIEDDVQQLISEQEPA